MLKTEKDIFDICDEQNFDVRRLGNINDDWSIHCPACGMTHEYTALEIDRETGEYLGGGEWEDFDELSMLQHHSEQEILDFDPDVYAHDSGDIAIFLKCTRERREK